MRWKRNLLLAVSLRHALLLALSVSSMALGGYLVWHNVFVRPSQCVERADGR